MLDIEPSFIEWIIGAMALYVGLVAIRCIQSFQRWTERRRQWQSWRRFQQVREDAARASSGRTPDSTG